MTGNKKREILDILTKANKPLEYRQIAVKMKHHSWGEDKGILVELINEGKIIRDRNKLSLVAPPKKPGRPKGSVKK